MPTGIVTDSTACIPDELVQRYPIEVVPVNLIVAGRTYRDGLDDTTDFYRLLRSSREQASTAAPAPGTYLDRFRAIAARGADAILCLTVSSQFSAMFNSARAAAKLAETELPGVEVRVVDSGNAAMAQGFMVVEAARAAGGGAGLEEVARRAAAVGERAGLVVIIDTLDYLARSGRVPRIAAWASQVLQLKPIVQFQGGDIRLLARARTRPRAVDRLVDVVRQRAGGSAGLHVCIHHTNCPDDADLLRLRVEREMQPAEIHLSEFTQVMGTHTGPGLLGIAFYRE